MALYLETEAGFALWRGEPIGGVRHPLQIADLWSAEGLAAIGLYEPAETEVPAGTIVVGSTVQRVDGVVRYVHETIPAPGPTRDAVIFERNRRLALGFDYDFGDARGVHTFATTLEDMAGWDEVSKVAQALLSLGDTATTMQIVTETGPASVTAAEWQQVLLAAAAFRQPIWGASFILQSMDPIPADYASDARWP